MACRPDSVATVIYEIPARTAAVDHSGVRSSQGPLPPFPPSPSSPYAEAAADETCVDPPTRTMSNKRVSGSADGDRGSQASSPDRRQPEARRQTPFSEGGLNAVGVQAPPALMTPTFASRSSAKRLRDVKVDRPPETVQVSPGRTPTLVLPAMSQVASPSARGRAAKEPSSKEVSLQALADELGRLRQAYARSKSPSTSPVRCSPPRLQSPERASSSVPKMYVSHPATDKLIGEVSLCRERQRELFSESKRLMQAWSRRAQWLAGQHQEPQHFPSRRVFEPRPCESQGSHESQPFDLQPKETHQQQQHKESHHEPQPFDLQDNLANTTAESFSPTLRTWPRSPSESTIGCTSPLAQQVTARLGPPPTTCAQMSSPSRFAGVSLDEELQAATKLWTETARDSAPVGLPASLFGALGWSLDEEIEGLQHSMESAEEPIGGLHASAPSVDLKCREGTIAGLHLAALAVDRECRLLDAMRSWPRLT